jgi:hypothetical protein
MTPSTPTRAVTAVTGKAWPGRADVHSRGPVVSAVPLADCTLVAAIRQALERALGCAISDLGFIPKETRRGTR